MIPCIIPARGGSRGIPKKNIAMLNGKLIYQRKSAKEAQLTVLTWHEAIGQWGSQNFSTGTARKVSATLAQWVHHLNNTGQQFTLLQLDCRRQTLPAWHQIVADHNRRPWHT
jgi:hypothetical protein